MARASRKKSAIVRPVAGDLILAGHPGTTMPDDWFLAKVLWTDGDDVLTEHAPPGGDRYRQVLHVAHVRAIGSIPELAEFQHKAREAVAEMTSQVKVAEAELGRARAAVWAKLDQIDAAVPRLKAEAA
jgi:hypothetical protein